MLKIKILMLMAAISTIIFASWSTLRIVKYVQFDTGCEQHIKRAADANTVNMAKEELGKAIAYAEDNNLTSGIVSIFLHQPENDIGYWYKNMTEAYKELDKLPEESTPLERTNVLMKLRETLTDSGTTTCVTVPTGISIYPDNVLYMLIGLTSGIICAICWIIRLIMWLNRESY